MYCKQSITKCAILLRTPHSTKTPHIFEQIFIASFPRGFFFLISLIVKGEKL